MPEKPNTLRWVKEQIRRALADHDARVAAAPPLLRVPEAAPPVSEKRAQRQRCDARLRRSPAGLDRAMRAGPIALRKYLRRHHCRNWALPGSTRCRLHGAHSTGPVTPEGKSRTVAALKAGRARWLAKLKSEGKPVPCGRKKDGRNRSIEERAQAAWDRQCMRELRQTYRRIRTDRRTRRAKRRRERKMDADLAARRERFQAGGQFWTTEEWKTL
jgi:hypothetical protein